MKDTHVNTSNRRSSVRQSLSAAALVLAVGVGAASAAGGGKLIFNGKVASTDVQMVNGTAYVRLSDMAKALDMVVVKRGDGYEITKSGGANQIKGMVTGKVGDVLFDGKWRFQVVRVDTPDSYQMKTDADTYGTSGIASLDRKTHLVAPSRGRILVVVYCRVINGVKEKRTLWTAISDDKIHTALTDTEGGSHTPVAYDYEGAPIQSKWLLPGAAMNFPVIFSVPEGTQMKDLVFTLKNNQTADAPTDVRVSL